MEPIKSDQRAKKRVVVAHLHSDYKFVKESLTYDEALFANRTIILEGEESYRGPFRESAHFLKANRDSIPKIKRLCSDADIVVLYSLTHLMALIALALPSTTTIIWRFFGFELYSRSIERVTTESTQRYLRKGWPKWLYRSRNRLKKVTKKVIGWRGAEELFFEAVKRINYVEMLSSEEHSYLKGLFPTLPHFIQLPYLYREQEQPDLALKLSEKRPIVVVGNSRSYFNNHFDIINTIEKHPKKENYLFTLLLNYAEKTKYYRDLVETISTKSHYKIEEQFISPESFQSYYRGVSALVLNGMRQMAVDNIFIAIRDGVKIYLNSENLYYQFLINEGFIIFTTNELSQDLTSGNITLTQSEIDQNRESYRGVTEKYSVERFNREIIAITE
ncbi:MAG: hypothetical protein WC960_07465 [Bacteroidales bacterium]